MGSSHSGASPSDLQACWLRFQVRIQGVLRVLGLFVELFQGLLFILRVSLIVGVRERVKFRDLWWDYFLERMSA